MHRFTVATILLACGSLCLSQIPYPNGPPDPVTPPDTGQLKALHYVFYWDNFPLVWFAQLGLIIIWIEYRKLIDIEKEKLECLSEK